MSICRTAPLPVRAIRAGRFPPPSGRTSVYEFYGENVFRSDMCNADVKLGDLLIHEGSAKDAQKYAARVFNADKTYFVLNGTSSANKVVTNALLTRGDLVLFDRNNHKSNHHGALIQAGATPVYLEAARNPLALLAASMRTVSTRRICASRRRSRHSARISRVRSGWRSSSLVPTMARYTTRAGGGSHRASV